MWLLFAAPIGLSLTATCLLAQTPTFSPGVILGTNSAWQIWEASGLIASRQNPGVLWTHNDSGFPGTIFAISTNGNLLASYAVSNVFSGDFEDIAIGPGPVPGLHYIYLGDIGDNFVSRSSIRVFRIPEPAIYAYQSNAPPSLTAIGAVEIVLTYPDGAHNAEALLIDPRSGDLFVPTKMTNSCAVYQATRAQLESGQTVTLTLGPSPAIRSVSAGDISSDGSLIALRRASRGEVWVRSSGQTVSDALESTSTRIPVIGQPTEPNGEALAFHPTGLGYYTLSEGSSQPIYFFARNDNNRPRQPQVFVLPGDSWRYADTGADEGSHWLQINFDDAHWSEGAGQFGYGQGDEQTTISFGDDNLHKHITSYFRKRFEITSLSTLSNLALRVCFNDGLAIYLNGEEVWRYNLPSGASFDTPATAPRSDWQNIWWSIPLNPALLHLEENTIAVEVHRYAPDGPDLSFDLQLLEGAVDLPAHFVGLPQIADSMCTLEISGPVGSLITVEASDDLISWSSAGQVTLDAAGAGQFKEALKNEGPRFYRLPDRLRGD